MTKLDDHVKLDPGVNPADIERCLVEAVNYGWKIGGNDGRCLVPANFVAWSLQEIERLRTALEWIKVHYPDPDLKHLDFRVEAYCRALEGLDKEQFGGGAS